MTTSPIEDLAIRVGSYIPRSAGMGASYFRGSFSVDPARLAAGDFPGVRTPQDEYIPSIPELNVTTAGEQLNDGNDNNNDSQDDTTQNSASEFTPEEQRIIDDLQTRDREVRDHEQAHISAGGAYISGGATFEYESGPDKRRYAVGGEVSIDSSPVRDNPEATIAKMQVVRAAALAPVNPSGQDRAVAASASRQEGQARADLAERRTVEARGDAEDGGNSGGRNAVEADNRRQSRIYTDAAAAYVGADPFAALMRLPVINYAV